jgi:hypothetical protein
VRKGTNWYLIGALYVRELREQGDDAKADKAEQRLHSPTGGR